MVSTQKHRQKPLTAALGLGLLSLAAAGFANAACQGPPLPAQADTNGSLVPAVYRPTSLTWFDPASDFDEARIVGLWEFEMRLVGNQNGLADKALLDWGTSIWHDDGTEMMVSGGRPPSAGDVCMGVWKQVGREKFKLHHVALGLTPPVASGTYIGPTAIDELVTVDPSGKKYTGTFTLNIYAGSPDSGTEFDMTSAPVVTFKGVITAHRVTVD